MQPAVFTSFKEEGTFTLTQRKFDLNEKCIWLAVPPTIIFKNTYLWLHIHQTDLVLIQNSVNGVQTGAIEILFILAVLNKPAETHHYH